MLLLVKVPGLFRKPVLSRLPSSQGQSGPDADGESPPKLRWPRSEAGPMVSKRPFRPRYGHKANYGACQTDYQPKELTHPSSRTTLTIVDSGSEIYTYWKSKQLGKTSKKKKTFSFGHCPNHLNPPPSPQFGQLGPFFRKSKFKI